MIEIRVSGGIGNQLFQYAFGYALARANNQKLVLDKSYFDFDNSRTYELNKFTLDLNNIVSYMDGIADKGIRRYIQMLLRVQKKRYKLKQYRIIQEKDNVPDYLGIGNFYFRGFWQNEKYFKQYREKLIEQIVPNWELSEMHKIWLHDIEKKKSASIHIRRTDYLKYQAAIDPEYYFKAVKKILEIEKIEMFYIFTDDVEWTEKYFASYPIEISFKIVSGREELSDLDELMLMKACKHHIVANSSFSWWGGVARRK